MAKATKHHEVEDTITKITKKLEKFISQNLKVMIIAIAVIVVGLAAYFSLDYIFKIKGAKANSAFGKIYLAYEDIINNKDFKDNELNEKLLGLNKEFEVVLEEYPGTSAASKSAYFIGDSLYKAKRYNDALEYFQKGYSRGIGPKGLHLNGLKFSKSKSYIEIQCLKGEASCYEQLEEYEKAEKVYMEIIDRYSNSYIIPLVKYNLGQLYEKQDKFELAEREYTQIITNYEWSSWKDLAEKRLLLIKNFM
jgi:tetratricopeptide (TPR) repeat protein